MRVNCPTCRNIIKRGKAQAHLFKCAEYNRCDICGPDDRDCPRTYYTQVSDLYRLHPEFATVVPKFPKEDPKMSNIKLKPSEAIPLSYEVYRAGSEHVAAVIDIQPDQSLVVFGKYGPLDFTLPSTQEFFVINCDKIQDAKAFAADHATVTPCEIVINNVHFDGLLSGVSEINKLDITLEFESGFDVFDMHGDYPANIELTLNSPEDPKTSYMIKCKQVRSVDDNKITLQTDGFHYVLENRIKIKTYVLSPK